MYFRTIRCLMYCRTIRWLDRCLAAHKRPNEQSIFPIVQGGLDGSLRTQCALGWCLRSVLKLV